MFGARIKELRIEKNITQKQLAQILECNQSMISQWENNICEPTETNIRNAAIFFDVSTDYLLGLEDEAGAKTRTQVNTLSYFHNSGTIKF